MIKINLVIDPAGGRMSILKEQGKKVKIYTYRGIYDIDLFDRNIRLVKYLQDIIDDTRGKDKTEKVVIDMYMEKPRIAQRYQGRVVEKGFCYRIHWIISTIITIFSISPNIEVNKVCLIGVNKWYYSLGLNKGGRKFRKKNAIDFAEDIVKEFNIELKQLKEDEADAIGLWYYVKEVLNYEVIGATDTKTAAMNILSKKKRQKEIDLKKEVIDWFNK